MIRSFRNQHSEDVFNGVQNKKAAKVLLNRVTALAELACCARGMYA